MKLISRLGKELELTSITSVILLKRLCELLLLEESNQVEEKRLRSKSVLEMNLLRLFCTLKWVLVRAVISIWLRLKKEMKCVLKISMKESLEELLENHMDMRSVI